MGFLKMGHTNQIIIDIDLNSIISIISPAIICGVFSFGKSHNNSPNLNAEVLYIWQQFEGKSETNRP